MDFFIIAVMGSAGALARYGVYLLGKNFTPHSIHYFTLLINLSGCFLAGLILGHSSSSSHRYYYTLFSIGFIGSFTTFSAFGVETLSFIENKQYSTAIINMGLNLIGGIALILLGRALTLRNG